MCCERVVGCDECVKKWRGTHSRCPLCSVEGRMTNSFILKGVDGITGIFRVSDDSESVLVVDGNPTSSEDSANEFEEMPSFRSTSNSA